MAALLAARACTIRFGGLVAVKDLNLEVNPGELFGLIGPNGAGKTTVFNLITGIYAPTSGTIDFDGKAIQGRPAHRIAAAGIVPEVRQRGLGRAARILARSASSTLTTPVARS